MQNVNFQIFDILTIWYDVVKMSIFNFLSYWRIVAAHQKRHFTCPFYASVNSNNAVVTIVTWLQLCNRFDLLNALLDYPTFYTKLHIRVALISRETGKISALFIKWWTLNIVIYGPVYINSVGIIHCYILNVWLILNS